MRPPRACLAVALVALLALTGLADARFVQGKRQTPPRSDRIIVHVNPDDGDVAGAAHGVAAATGLSYSNSLGNGFVVLEANGEPSRAAGAHLAIVAAMERGRGGGPPDTTPMGQAIARGKVSSVEEDYIVLPMTTPPKECAKGCVADGGGGGGGLWGMEAIQAVGLWTKVPDSILALPRATFRGGVIDTGAQFSHVQLVGQLDSGTSRGYKRGSIVSADDTDGHGTHTSTTVAGKWNNDAQGGIAGIVDNVDLVACKFLFAGGGTTSDAVLCLDYLRANNVTISNNSWGGGGSSSALLAAIKAVCKEGGLFVVAAGNDGVNITAGRYPSYPAAYVAEKDIDCVLPVAAANRTGTLASWSNWGLAVPLAAPGVLIRSAISSKTSNTREAEWSGTSMAAPHVTGVALMLKHAFPKLNGTHIKEAMVSTATVMPYTGVTIGGGLLNAAKAYERALEINRQL